jgi:hypothetical protein
MLLYCLTWRLTCMNCWQRTVTVMLLLDGWLTALWPKQITVCFHGQLMWICSWCDSLEWLFSLPLSLVTKGFGCQVMCSVQSLHKRPGWAAYMIHRFLQGGEPNLGSIKLKMQLSRVTCQVLLMSCHVMFLYWTEASFLCHCLRAVGLMCSDMEHVQSSDTWASSIASAHRIWAKDVGLPTPGLLGSSCTWSVLFQEAFDIWFYSCFQIEPWHLTFVHVCLLPRDCMLEQVIDTLEKMEPAQKKAGRLHFVN